MVGGVQDDVHGDVIDAAGPGFRLGVLVMPRPRNLWVVKGSGLMLTEEAVEFSAGRIEGALILF